MPPKGYGDQGSGCFGKTRFEAYQGAQARKLARNITRRSKQLATAYRCQWCDGWHVGRGSHRPKALPIRPDRLRVAVSRPESRP